MTSSRVLVITTDPLGDRMPGPAIRAWHLAEVLSSHHEVTLASTVRADRSHPSVRVVNVSGVGLRRRAGLALWADVVVMPAGVLHEWPSLASLEKPLVIDLYDPFHLENLEPGSGETPGGPEHSQRVTRMVDSVDAHLRRGDFFLCATERQRDFWMGALASIGRVNPATYAEDAALRRLIDVVPFGIPGFSAERSGKGLRGVVAGIGADDRVLLWAGGLYNWFDPITLIRAAAAVAPRLRNLRLVFMGLTHPNPAVPTMRVAAEARELSDSLGTTGKTVFFNEGWVPYDRRADYLLDADAGVSTHVDHVEARYSSRTRILDYLWSGLPMVLTGGDVLADMVCAEGLGVCVAPSDQGALERAIEDVLTRERPPAERFDTLRRKLSWESVAAPLAEFCSAPRAAPDLARGPDEPPGYARQVAGFREALKSARDRIVSPPVRSAMEPIMERLGELERVLSDQGDAADDVAEVFGRTLTRLSAQVDALSLETARLRAVIEAASPPKHP